MQRFAHVALDLTLIAGLAILAVTLVTMQGVMDINVLSAISLLFLLVGTIGHLSRTEFFFSICLFVGSVQGLFP